MENLWLVFIQPDRQFWKFGRDYYGLGGIKQLMWQKSIKSKMNKSLAQRHFSVLSEGDIGGYPIPKEKLANTEIQRQNRRNADAAFMIGQVYLKLYPSRVFVYLKHVCTRNQPQTLRENVRRPWSVERSKSPVTVCSS